MSEKIAYVVEQGEYSDRGTEGVFTTREKAEAFIQAWRDGLARAGQRTYRDEPIIVEYRMDVPVEDVGAWGVWIDAAGNVASSYYNEWGNPKAPPHEAQWVSVGNRARFCGYGRTVEHARRSAEELRRQTLTVTGEPASPSDLPH